MRNTAAADSRSGRDETAPPSPVPVSMPEGTPSSVKLTVERLPESQVLLDIAADEDEYAQAIERAARKVSREVVIPGFRKGKVPRHMIERLLGRTVFVEEANRELMDTLYRKAIQQEALVPVGDPDVELVNAEPINFKVTVPVYPTVDPGPYRDVRVDPIDAAVAESAVEEVLARLQKNHSPWVDPAEPRTPREGDQVTIDLAVREGDEEFTEPTADAVFVLGESNLFEQLREAIERLDIGETATTEITFAEDDESAGDRLRGKTLQYTITLNGLKERDILPLDDEFAKTVGDNETIAELRQEIWDDLHQQKTTEARTDAFNQIVDKIGEGARIEIPAAMVDDAVTERVQRLRNRLNYGGRGATLESYLHANNQTEEELKAELRPAIAKRLRNSLILREIAEREGIEIGDADIEAEVVDITAEAPDPDAVRQFYLGDRYMRSLLRNEIFDRRLTDRLIDIATEGRGAVTNAWVKPETAPATEADGTETDGATDPDAAAVETTPTAVAAGWIEGDGSHDCPPGYPIKGNATSQIYHLPGHGTYDQALPETCFASEGDAVAAGYRPSHGGAHHATPETGDETTDEV